MTTIPDAEVEAGQAALMKVNSFLAKDNMIIALTAAATVRAAVPSVEEIARVKSAVDELTKIKVSMDAASEWMREDDRELRKNFSKTCDELNSAILALLSSSSNMTAGGSK